MSTPALGNPRATGERTGIAPSSELTADDAAQQVAASSKRANAGEARAQRAAGERSGIAPSSGLTVDDAAQQVAASSKRANAGKAGAARAQRAAGERSS